MEIDIFIISEIGFELLFSGSNEHISHEKSVVASRAQNSELESVLRVPAGVSINDVKLLLICF
jgi:hypothetical protein